MAGLTDILLNRLQAGFDTVEKDADPVLRPSTRPGSDFQANGAMPLAKRLGAKPADIARQIVEGADLAGVCTAEVAPQGFINLSVEDAFIASLLTEPTAGATDAPKTVVVDYSGPNVAKEMHVGHLRTTVIGDAICHMLEFAGHRVIRENHIGDWGTNFGMLIEHMIDVGEETASQELSVGDLDSFYRQARSAFAASPEFQDRSRARVVLLQSGDEETLRMWHVLVDQSVAYFEEVYAKLRVSLTADHVVGESFYNDALPLVVAELDSKGLLVESDGALCAFPDGYVNRDGDPLPLIVQKSDGGFGYAATDLATVRDRFGREAADLALYVVGAPQAQHLSMCFDVATAAGYAARRDQLVHVPFGNMLGSDRKMFKSRSGETVKLIDLLDEAVERAAAVIKEKNPDLDPGERDEVATMVGIGALKYADLSTDRVKDYVFDWDRMLSFDGNTAPYLQYARVRCLSIFRRGGIPIERYLSGAVPVSIREPAERALALSLLAFPDAVAAAMETWSPHKLCSYLFDLAGQYTTFFEACPVLKAPSEAERDSRLVLCALTASALGQGLGLLGIEAPDRM